MNIKEDTATVNGILEKEARRGGTKAASQSDVFIDRLSQAPENVNGKHSDCAPDLVRFFALASNAKYAFSSKNGPIVMQTRKFPKKLTGIASFQLLRLTGSHIQSSLRFGA